MLKLTSGSLIAVPTFASSGVLKQGRGMWKRDRIGHAGKSCWSRGSDLHPSKLRPQRELLLRQVPRLPRLSAVHPLTLRGDISYGPFCRPWLLFKLGTACRRRISWTTSSRWQWTSTSAKAGRVNQECPSLWDVESHRASRSRTCSSATKRASRGVPHKFGVLAQVPRPAEQIATH